MVSRFTLYTALAAAVSAVLAQDPLRVETPLNVVVCRPVQFTFSGGTGPYFLTAHPAGQAAAPPTIDFDQVEGSPFRWEPNLEAGTSLFLRIADQTGATAESGPFTILAGTDRSCIDSPAAPSEGADSSAPADPSTPAASVPAPSGTSPSGLVTSRTPAPSGSSASSSGARPSASDAAEEEGAAFSNYVSTGALGLAAIAGAAILL